MDSVDSGIQTAKGIVRSTQEDKVYIQEPGHLPSRKVGG